MYIAEIAPPSMRGRMGALYQLAIIIGILLSYSMNYLLRDAGQANWRWMFSTGVAPAILFFVLLMRAPETPRFLAMTNRHREALWVLERIAGPECAAVEMKEILGSFDGKPHSWGDLLGPGVRRAVVVGFCLAILIHVSGINTIIDYAPAIFQSAGWKIDAALFSTFIVGVTNAVFTVTSFWTIDRWGRKPLYITGSLGMTAALTVLTVLAARGAFHGLIVIVLLLIYLAFFASCVGPVFWTLVPEIFPNRIRGTAMTVPVLTQWVANAMVVLLFPLAFHQMSKSVTFGFLAAMSLSQAIFTWFFVPETKGETLERIEEFWKLGVMK
jgi:SP family arabinose:H+ symporter-like MFS transporter